MDPDEDALRARYTLVDHVGLGFEDLAAARRLYSDGSYGAFVLDAQDNNLEAVFHG